MGLVLLKEDVMAEHTSDDDLKAEEKSFIREKMVEPERSKSFYRKAALAVLGAVIVLGIAIGASFAFVLHHLQDGAAETRPGIDIAIERDTVPETTDSETEAVETVPVETVSPGAVEEADREEIQHIFTSMMQEMGQNSILSELVNRSCYTAYETVSHSLVAVRNSTEDTAGLETEPEAAETFGVIVAMSDYEAVVLCPSAALDLEAPFQVQIQEYAIEAAFKQVDAQTGIAALTVNLRQLPDRVRMTLSAIELGNSYNVKLGEPVLLAGSPLGACNSVMAANVTYLKKEMPVSDAVVRLIYTDVPYRESCSGILLDAKGALIGWLTSRYSDGALQEWTAAVGISELKAVMEDLILGQDTAALGVVAKSISAPLAERLSLPEGLYVTDVDSQSPAYEAGIQNGDVITAINGTEVHSVRSLQNFLEDAQPDTEVTVQVMRLGRDAYKEIDFTVKLGGR